MMYRARLAAIALLSLSTLVVSGAPAQEAKPQKKSAFFGLDKMWDVHITLAKEEDWNSLSRRFRRGRGFGGRGSRPYVKAQIRIAGHEIKDVGIRLKGASTYTYSAGTMKRSFKVDFDRYVEGQEFLGFKKLSLNNNVTDPTQVREAVTYKAYRDAGVPGSRTCFSRVFITIQGLCENEYLGMYTIIEQFDRQLMKRWFGNKRGLLVKPVRSILGYYGDEWNTRYESSYQPKVEVQKVYTRPLIELARLMGEDDKTFAAQLDSVLDVEMFFKYMAVTVITANTDSPLNLAHNYYLAVPDRIRKVVWIPWDLNLALNGWGRAGPNQDVMSLVEPSRMAFLSRVLDVGSNEDRYKDQIRKLVEGCCSAKTLKESIKLARATTAEAIAMEARRSRLVTEADDNSRFRRRDISRFGGSLPLEEFVDRREASVLAQLDGRSEGVPGGTSRNFNRNSRNFSRMPASNVPATTSSTRVRGLIYTASKRREQRLYALQEVQALASQVFASLDKDASKDLEAEEMAAALVPGSGKVRPHHTRVAARYARRIIRDLTGQAAAKATGEKTGQAAGDKSRAVTSKQWQAGVTKWFTEWDRDGNGKLTRRELSGRAGKYQARFQSGRR